jgi:hypothetical protein
MLSEVFYKKNLFAGGLLIVFLYIFGLLVLGTIK